MGFDRVHTKSNLKASRFVMLQLKVLHMCYSPDSPASPSDTADEAELVGYQGTCSLIYFLISVKSLVELLQ